MKQEEINYFIDMPRNCRFIDRTNRRYGRLLVLSFAGVKNKKTMWRCICDCGNELIVKGELLANGHTKSCGCLSTQIKRAPKKHGLRYHPLYHTWLNMKDRCLNPNNSHYHIYGGRGVGICDEWKANFTSFYEWAIANGWSKGLSIERIDVNKGYYPENCIWIPLSQQSLNKRNTIKVEVGEETLSVHEYAASIKCPPVTIYSRIARNGSASVVLRPPKTPVLQFDVNGKFIAEYESATLAAKTVGTSQSGITKCCQGHYKTCMGYVFKYKNKVSQKL